MAPLEMAGSMVEDERLKAIISTVTLFVESLQSIFGVLKGYDGGDYCAGLIFGINGSALLVKIGQSIVDALNK